MKRSAGLSVGLDLYAKVESLLGFEEARKRLHALFLEKLKRLGVNKVLDIGCGSGCFMQIAQEEGMEVVGIDLSLVMVEAARQKGLNAYRMNLCDVTERFDAAVAIFDVLNYIRPADLGHFLECAAMTLKCGGICCAISIRQKVLRWPTGQSLKTEQHVCLCGRGVMAAS